MFYICTAKFEYNAKKKKMNFHVLLFILQSIILDTLLYKQNKIPKPQSFSIFAFCIWRFDIT